MTTIDFITDLFCRIDDQMQTLPPISFSRLYRRDRKAVRVVVFEGVSGVPGDRA